MHPSIRDRTLPQRLLVASQDLFLPLYYLPSLINNCLSLPIRTQGEVWRPWRKPYFLYQKWGTQNGLGPGGPTVVGINNSTQEAVQGWCRWPWDVFGGPGSSQPLLSPSIVVVSSEADKWGGSPIAKRWKAPVSCIYHPSKKQSRFPSNPPTDLGFSFLKGYASDLAARELEEGFYSLTRPTILVRS